MADNPKLKGSIPMMVGSQAQNVIPESVEIEGTIRNYDIDYATNVVKKMEEKAKEICEAKDFGLEIGNIVGMFLPVKNDDGPTEWVRKAVIESYGSEEYLTEEGCPVMASEDFSDFTNVGVPGCFWFASHGISDEGVTLHSSEFIFDDGIIEPVSRLWMKLIEMRLNNEE